MDAMERQKLKPARQNHSRPKRARRSLRNGPPLINAATSSPSNDADCSPDGVAGLASGDASVELNNPDQYLKRFTRVEVAQQLLFDSGDDSEESEAEAESLGSRKRETNTKTGHIPLRQDLPSRTIQIPMKTRAHFQAERTSRSRNSSIPNARNSPLHANSVASKKALKRLTRSKIILLEKAQTKTDVVYRRRYIINEASSAVAGKSTAKHSALSAKSASKQDPETKTSRAHGKKNIPVRRTDANVGSVGEPVPSDVESTQQHSVQRRSPRRKQQQIDVVTKSKVAQRGKITKNCDIDRAFLDLSLNDAPRKNVSIDGHGDDGDVDDAAEEERLAIAGDVPGHILGTDEGGDLLPLAQANKRTSKKQRGKKTVILRPNRADVISRAAIARVENCLDAESCASWENRSEQIFSDLHLLLIHKHNVLVKGTGSKRNLFKQFSASEKLEDVHHIVVNGFDPSFSMPKLLRTVMQAAYMSDSHIRSSLRTLNNTTRGDKLFDDAFANLNKHLSRNLHGDAMFIILNNIDGPVLRHIHSQRLLARLSRLDNVRVLASYDFDDVGLLWPLDVLMLFDWVEYSCDTFEQYAFELQFDRSQQRREADERRLSALNAVFSSMTLNSKRIFLIVTKYQLQELVDAEFDQNSQRVGMPYDLLRETCLAEMLSSSDSALRHQLSEYEDHKLLRIKRGFDGSEILEILLPCEALKEFYAKQPDEMKELL